MYKYKHGVQVTALGIVVAPISRSQKKKKKKIDTSSLLSILVVDDPSCQDVTIIIKRSTAP